ncbi:MAG: polymer-forming cytoskeletal protein [Gammaproteobacteria bacterium]|nr:polymer-forming cytoskeletal protein [Gammaproteobacteria bacterium]MDH5800852.1 polymer-forming cytoskeletal protein [Gammaproteobacteria bacterium]
MFGSKKAKISSEIDSLVGGNTTIKGDVMFTGGLHIDGVVRGSVVAESEQSLLTTSDRGRIEGNVKVHSIVLNGEVVGDVHAYKHIELAANARVTGNVYYQVIEMAMGAEVNGSLIHLSKEQVPATVVPEVIEEKAVAEPSVEEKVLDSIPESQEGPAFEAEPDDQGQTYQFSVK